MPTASPSGEALSLLLRGLPRAEQPDNAALLDRVERAVREGALDARAVEPSLDGDAAALRFITNATLPGPRAPISSTLARWVGVPEVGQAPIEAWLAERSRELFVGYADAAGARRAKLYFRGGAGDGLVELARALGLTPPAGAARAHLLCVDYSEGALLGAKWYERLDGPTARRREVGRQLLEFLEQRGASPGALYLSRRVTVGGAPYEEALHAQVETLRGTEPVSVLWARALGASALEARLRRLHQRVALRTRVLSLASDGRGVAYLALEGASAQGETRRP